MRAEYDPTALTLMRAIKGGIDPRGIMNPGTLLPPPAPLSIPPPSATIDTQSVDDWIVKPGSLTAPVETDQHLKSVVEGTDSTRESGSIMGGLKKIGSGIVGAVGLRKEESDPTAVPILTYVEPKGEGWKEEGDGA
jgi:hypothetical protein